MFELSTEQPKTIFTVTRGGKIEFADGMFKDEATTQAAQLLAEKFSALHQAQAAEITRLRALVAETGTLAARRADLIEAQVSSIRRQTDEITRLRAELATARRDGMEMPSEFLQWMKDQMPSGTHIHNPEWWAKRIWEAAIRAAAVEVKP